MLILSTAISLLAIYHLALQGVSAAPDAVVQRDSNTIKKFWNKDARSDPSHVQAFWGWWASPAVYEKMKNDKAGFEKMFHPDGMDGENVERATVTLFNPGGATTSDIEVTYEEAEGVATKYGRDFSGYKDGWYVSALQAAVEKFRDGGYSKEKMMLRDKQPCLKAEEGLRLLTGQEVRGLSQERGMTIQDMAPVLKAAKDGTAILVADGWANGQSGLKKNMIYGLDKPIVHGEDWSVDFVDVESNKRGTLRQDNEVLFRRLWCVVWTDKP